MKTRLYAAVCPAALILSAGVTMDARLSPAMAQEDDSFQSFHDQLAPYGDWVYSDRWGEVWIPEDVPDDFRPYGTGGHWVYTEDYGWYWVSDYDWGDIPFHYGRWVNDPDDGWMWIPGYVWGPGWVVWRHNGQYTGWMPMPPDESFLGYGPATTSVGISIGGLSISFNSGDDYGYRRWYGSGYGEDRFASNWIFIGTRHMGDRDYRRYEAPRQNYVNLIHNTTNITHYTVVNNYVVNRSIDPNAVRRAGGHIQTVKVADVVKKPQLITNVDVGRKMQMHARELRPHGNGMANSAPKPTSLQIQSLSTKAPHVHGKPPMHLFTRETVTKAPLVAKPAMTAPMTGKPGMMHGVTPPKTGVMANPPVTTVPRETTKGRKLHPELPNNPNMQVPGATQTTTPEQPAEEFGKRKHEHMKAPVTSPSAINPPPTINRPLSTPMEARPHHPEVHKVVPNVETAHPAIERPVKPPKVEAPQERKTEVPPKEKKGKQETPH